jgi:hypothetical protein
VGRRSGERFREERAGKPGGCTKKYRRIKKEAFRRGREGFFVFRGLSWSQAQNGKRFFCLDQSCRRQPRCRRKRFAYFLPLVVFFLPDDFLAAFFFVAMALVPPF